MDAARADEFRTTSTWAAEYAHPVEMCAGNFGTLAVGVVLLAPALPTILLFTVVSVLTILVHHSGYALPWASWSVHHDWHHYRIKEAFGTLGLLDRVLGTQPELAELARRSSSAEADDDPRRADSASLVDGFDRR